MNPKTWRSPLVPPVVSWHREEGPFDSCGGDDGGLVAGWGGAGGGCPGAPGV